MEGSAVWAITATSDGLVGILLSITFGCGLFIAAAHVANRAFIAPVYDVVANLLAFACSSVASALLDQPIPAVLSAAAVGCWVWLARRTHGAETAQRTGMPHSKAQETP